MTRRVADSDRVINQTNRIIVLGNTVALLFFAAALLLIRATERERRAAQGELRLANETLEQRVRDRTTQLQKAVDQLIARERSLRFLADAMPQLVWAARSDGTAETFNRGWCDFTGLTSEQSKTDGWATVLHPDDTAATYRIWGEVLSSAREGGGEYRLRCAADGAWRWHLWRARPEHDADGQLVRWVGTSTDIHDQKAAAEVLETRVRERTDELAHVSELQRGVLDGTIYSIIATGLDGVITVFNAGAEKMLGYTREEMIGLRISAVWHDAGEVATRAAELSRKFGRPIEPGFETFVAHARLGDVDEHEWTDRKSVV